MTDFNLLRQLYIIEALQDNPLQIQAEVLSLHPEILSSLAKELWTLLIPLHFHFICPIDIASIPLATCLSIAQNLSMIPLCYEKIEDLVRPGQTALLLSASSFSSSHIQSAFKKLTNLQVLVPHAALLLEGSPEEKKTSEHLKIELHNLWSLEKVQNSYSKIHSFDIS